MERRTAAVFALDMVGYSRLIEIDEADTLERLAAFRARLIDPLIQRHGGRVVKGMGDGVLAEFPEAASAIECALAIQASVAREERDQPHDRRIAFRIGINTGEVLEDAGDLYGGEVNIAARVEALADPGGILITGDARAQLPNDLPYELEDLGRHLVKNIRAPVRVYRVLPEAPGHGFQRLFRRLRKRKIVQWGIAYFAGAWLLLEMFDLVAEQFLWPVWVRQASTVLVLFGGLVTIVLAWYHGERGRQKVGAVELLVLVVILALGGQSIWLLKDRSERLQAEASGPPQGFREEPPAEHSVAVLPCANLGRDEAQGYFADGLAAELITRLAAVGGLRIPSHTSSFSFRGQNVTLGAVAAALKVRHVLECDVSGDESRLRIGARLIDAETGYTLWSETFNRSRAMMLDVQEEVAMAVVRSLEIRLVERERLLVGRRWTGSPEAYDEFLKGIELQRGVPEAANLAISLEHLERAVELDPAFGRAYARMALHWVIMSNWGFERAKEANAKAERLARQAIELDGDLFEAHWLIGWIHFVRYAWGDAEASFRKVVELAPGNWEGYHSLGFLLGVLGRYDEAMTAARIATDLDPLSYWPRRGIEILHSRQRQWEDAVAITLEIGTRNGWAPFMRAWLGVLQIRAGAIEAGRATVAEVEAGDPTDGNARLALAMAFSALGDWDRAESLAGQVRDDYRDGGDLVLPGTLAITYACLDEPEVALGFLQEARGNEDVELLFLDDPCFDNLRQDPRFVDLVDSLQLPERIYLQPAAASGT
jgi:adenylate cyclase